MTISVFRQLTDARVYITDPAKWYKGGYTPKGVSGLNEPGCSACAIGALAIATAPLVERAADQLPFSRHTEQAEVALVVLTEMGVPAFNDDTNTTHADILALFDRAIIAAAEKEFLAFAAAKPADETYNYIDGGNCAFSQFLKRALDVGETHCDAIYGYEYKGVRFDMPERIELAVIARPWTFGGIVKRLSAKPE